MEPTLDGLRSMLSACPLAFEFVIEEGVDREGSRVVLGPAGHAMLGGDRLAVRLSRRGDELRVNWQVIGERAARECEVAGRSGGLALRWLFGERAGQPRFAARYKVRPRGAVDAALAERVMAGREGCRLVRVSVVNVSVRPGFNLVAVFAVTPTSVAVADSLETLRVLCARLVP